MLDMAFQLLFFFIMTFNPADLEGQIDLSLPLSEKEGEKIWVCGLPGQAAPEFPSELTVRIRAQVDGEISAILVRALGGREETIAGRDEKDLLGRFGDQLEKKRKDLENKDAVKLQGDGKLKAKALIQVLDVCRKAGFTNVSFVPPEE
jgi:biopolymer transport protein ExbD